MEILEISWHSEVRGYLARGPLLPTCCFRNLPKPSEAKKLRKCHGQSECVLSQILTFFKYKLALILLLADAADWHYSRAHQAEGCYHSACPAEQPDASVVQSEVNRDNRNQ